MKRSFLLLFCAATLSANAQVNDVLTPLHLMQPQYDTPYRIPEQAQVKADIDRVLQYLDESIPYELDATGEHLKAGSFRPTSYETGVTYAACLAAAKSCEDSKYYEFTNRRLLAISKLSSKISDKVKKDPRFDNEMRRVVVPGALDDAGAMASAYVRLLLSNEGKPTPLAKKGLVAQENMLMLKTVKNYVDFVRDQQYRLADGIFARERPRHNTVWLDDMYMGVPCLAWYGAYAKDLSYLHDAVQQIRLFKQRMWVQEQQLFRHGWVESMNPHPVFPWGRANGWALLTMCEVLDAIQVANNPSLNEDRAFVLELLQQHIEGLCKLQDKTGFWHQLLNDPDTYLETSCTAIYTYCMAHAICEGWIDAAAYGPQTLLAWNAVSTQINSLGQVENTCVGSGMGFDRAFYAYRPVHVMAAHGYGPVIWAGSEVVRLLGCTHPKFNDSAIHFYPTEQKTDKPIFSESVTEEELLW